MNKAEVKEQPPRIETLETELARLFRRRRHGCDHETEIADDIEHDVRRLLERFDLLGIVEKSFATASKCGFCQATEWQIVHKQWCIEAK